MSDQTVAGTEHGAGDSPTEYVVLDYPPTGNTATAWSEDQVDDDPEPGWRDALADVARPLFALCAAALVIIGTCWGLIEWHRSEQPAPPAAPVVMPAAALPPISSTPAAPPPGRDALFLQALSQIPLEIFQPQLSINGGHWVCGQIAGGVAEPEVISELSKMEPRLKGSDPAAFVHAAENIYCPPPGESSWKTAD